MDSVFGPDPVQPGMGQSPRSRGTASRTICVSRDVARLSRVHSPSMPRLRPPSLAPLSIAVWVLAASLLALPGCSREPKQAEWSRYESDWFAVQHPEDFAARPSLESADGGYESVFFDAPDGSASFYVFSPQWGGQPLDIVVQPDREREVAADVIQTERGTRTVRTIASIEDESVRVVEENREGDGAVFWVTAFEYRDESAQKRYADAYGRFKDSLEQFAD